MSIHSPTLMQEVSQPAIESWIFLLLSPKSVNGDRRHRLHPSGYSNKETTSPTQKAILQGKHGTLNTSKA
jgi:hypothetical protein